MKSFRHVCLALTLFVLAPLSQAWALGTVYGTITGNGSPLTNRGVILCKLHGAVCTDCTYAYTDQSGSYSFTDLDPAPYYVYTYTTDSSYLATTYYGNTTKSCDAQLFIVAAASNLQRNINVVVGGKISGTVKTNGGVSSSTLYVICIDDTNGYFISAPTSTVDGTYTTLATPGGSYYCYVNYGGKARYYNNKTSRQEADPVPVVANQVTEHIDFNLTGSAGMGTAVVPLCGQ